ncbi:hypothetical protein BH09VER1_BH09VER1_53930 [soil metagenome]
MSQVIDMPGEFRRELPTVLGCRDYREEERLLERVDRVLRESGLKRKFLALSQGRFEREAERPREAWERVQARGRALERHLRHSVRALRCTVLKKGWWEEATGK